METYVRTTVEEPFPLFYSHVARKTELRPETAQGPFIAAGSEHLIPYTVRNHLWKLWSARGLRDNGWTVRVDLVCR